MRWPLVWRFLTSWIHLGFLPDKSQSNGITGITQGSKTLAGITQDSISLRGDETAVSIRANYLSLFKPMKLCFVHLPKCAGVYVQNYLSSIFKDRGWEVSNGYNLPMNRDFNQSELLELVSGDRDHHLIHNHWPQWSMEVMKKAKEAGYKFLSFTRYPPDLQCSSYFYFRYKLLNKVIDYDTFTLYGLNAPTFLGMSLEDFILKAFQDTSYWWFTREAFVLMDIVLPFNDVSFATVLKTWFDLPYTRMDRQNVSQNKGWDYYVKEGVFKPDTREMVLNHPLTRDWLTWSRYR